MQSWEDREAERLRQRYRDFDIWHVRHAAVRRTTWCARIKGDAVATINAASSDELEWLILELP